MWAHHQLRLKKKAKCSGPIPKPSWHVSNSAWHQPNPHLTHVQVGVGSEPRSSEYATPLTIDAAPVSQRIFGRGKLGWISSPWATPNNKKLGVLVWRPSGVWISVDPSGRGVGNSWRHQFKLMPQIILNRGSMDGCQRPSTPFSNPSTAGSFQAYK